MNQVPTGPERWVNSQAAFASPTRLFRPHDDVPALADDAEAKLFKDAHGVLMPDPKQLGHSSDGHFSFADFEELREDVIFASALLAPKGT